MAAIIPADWADAYNETTVTSLAIDLPIFDKAGVVFRLADLPADASNADIPTRKFTVVEMTLRFVASGGVNKLADQTQLFASSADGTTARTYTGFQHTASPSGTTGATTTSRPSFYAITDAATGEKFTVHQADITDTAGWETLVAAKVADIIT